MHAFLQDEFPFLAPAIRHFHVVRVPGNEYPEWKVLEPSGLRQETLAEILMSDQPASDAVVLDEEARQVLGEALRDRWIARSQRAPRPFIFRSGGLFRKGAKAWTIRSVVKHMDRHPEDGAHHLSNGTLEKWLREIGAPHLAELAGMSVRASPTDYRQALELFLVSTGLVKRRPPIVRPKRVDLGYIIAGQSASAVVQLRRKGGYCFGDLRASHPWMQVEPKSFQGEPCLARVTVNTASLLIDPEPYQASVIVSSPAMQERLEIPVRFRVVPMPSVLHYAVIRPAGAFLLTTVLGAGIGLLISLAGLWPRVVPSLPALFGPQITGAAFFGLLWGVMGIIWRALVPPAWPFLYGLWRLLMQVLKWTALLAVTILAGYGLAVWRLGIPMPLLENLIASAVLYGLGLAIVPAALSEIFGVRRRAARELTNAGRIRRIALLTAALLALLMVVLFLPQAMERIRENAQLQSGWASVQQWMIDIWTRFNNFVDEMLKGFYLRLYDRRAL